MKRKMKNSIAAILLLAISLPCTNVVAQHEDLKRIYLASFEHINRLEKYTF